LISYLFVRLCKSNDPRWWDRHWHLNRFWNAKYSVIFCVAVLITGVLTTNLRRHQKANGSGLARLFLPNVIWQGLHDCVSLDFLRHIHERDVRLRDEIKAAMIFTRADFVSVQGKLGEAGSFITNWNFLLRLF